jgi:hypothetical protein
MNTKKDQTSMVQQARKQPFQTLPNISAENASMRIRSRYLQRLGVAKFHKASKTVDRTSLKRRRKGSFIEALKTGAQDFDITVDSPPLPFQSSLQSRVSFESCVVVHSIPSHIDYSDRVRKALWTEPMEMEQEKIRNYVEFMAEGWDWRQVVEEDEFLVFENQLIHPVHAIRGPSVQERFLMRMKAQRVI